MRKIFIIAIFILAFSIFANAQGAVSYKFLEIVDYENKPVVGATVNIQGSCNGGTQKTNEKGQLDGGFPIGYGDCHTHSFSISKDGYYPYADIFSLIGVISKSNEIKTTKIELLKIPTTKIEEKAIGNEQLKRELFLAIYKRDKNSLHKLLKSKINPNLTTKELRGIPIGENIPAIIYAAGLGNNEALEELLSAGADIRSKESLAKNILITYLFSIPQTNPYWQCNEDKEEQKQLAIRYEKGFDLLIKAGADIEAKDKDGNSLLINALSRRNINLLKRVLTFNFSRKTKSEALKYLIYLPDSSDKSDLEYADLLIKAGGDPNFLADNIYYYTNFECASLLMLSARIGKSDFVKLLLANNAKVNLKCKDGKTALIAAITGKQLEIAKMLFDAGADGTGFSTYHRRTALMVAAENGYIEIVKTLLAKGLSITERDEWDESALEIALQSKAGKEMIEFLLKNGANPRGQTKSYCKFPLLYQGAYRNPEILRLLIAYKADVNVSCGENHTPIVYAARNGEAESVKILLENGADISGEKGKFALKYARENLNSQYPIVKSRAEQIIKILTEAGAK